MKCAACKDSGVVILSNEYPNLEDQIWCFCKAGQERLGRVAEIISRTESQRVVKVA